jgi:hypothetical protein
MPNQFNNPIKPGKGGKKDGVEGKTQPIPERTMNWPGLPGKTQPGGRNQGIQKTSKRGAKFDHAVSEGV